MQLKPEQLAAHLARGLKPIYTIHGDEPLAAQEAADTIRAAARREGYGERQVFVVAGARFDWSGLQGAAQSMSLFADKRLIEIRIPSGKPGKDGSEALQRYAAALPAETLTLVQLPKLDGMQQKSAWFSALDAAGVTLRADPVERRALPLWIAQRLAAQGQQVQGGADAEAGQRTLTFFADRVEGNLLAAHQEIQKLALLYPPGELSFSQVEAAVLDVARYDVFKLGEAVLGGQVARALRMLDGLRAAGEAPVFVHWTLAEDIRALRRASQALADGKPMPLALREARVWGAKERLFERLLPQVDSGALARWTEAAQICDGLVKGLKHPDWPPEPWDGLKRLLLIVLERSARVSTRLALHA